jgi:hypothetical protein
VECSGLISVSQCDRQDWTDRDSVTAVRFFPEIA